MQKGKVKDMWPIILLIIGLAGFFLVPNLFPNLFKASTPPSTNGTSGGNNGGEGQVDTTPAEIELEVTPVNFVKGLHKEITINVTANKNSEVDIEIVKLPNEVATKRILFEKIKIDEKNSRESKNKWTPEQSIEYGLYKIIARPIRGNGVVQEINIVEPFPEDELNDSSKVSPEEIEIGLTPNKQTRIYTVEILYPLKLNVDGKNQYYLLAPQLITFSEEKNYLQEIKLSTDSFELGKIKPYKLNFTLDFSSYFEEKKTIPKTIEGTLELDYDPPFENSKQTIDLKINLNESGAILYKKKAGDLDAFVNNLALKKGWDIIALGETQAELSANKNNTVFLQSDPTLVVIGQGTNGSQVNAEQVKEMITEEYSRRNGFTHLLIIGSENEIPLKDKEGTLDNEHKDQSLDSVYYGNVDDDPYIELSVGRITSSEVSNLNAYFDNAKKLAEQQPDYAYVKGTQRIYRSSGTPELSDEEKNNAFIRRQFIFTGYSPDFDGEQNAFKVTENPTNETIFDVFTTDCQVHAEGFNISNQRFCNASQVNVPTGLASNLILTTQNAGTLDNTQIIEAQYQQNPNQLYSVIPQKFSENIRPSIGVSFRDYLNGAIIFNNENVYNYIVGDPSTIVNIPSNLRNSQKQATMDIEANKVIIGFPKIEINDMFFLGKDKPFTDEETKNIKTGKFAKSDASVVEKKFPFVKNAYKERFYLTSVIMLDKNPLADEQELGKHLIVLKKFNGQPIQKTSEPEELQEAPEFSINEFDRIVVEISPSENIGAVSRGEVMSGKLSNDWPQSEIRNGKEYQTQVVTLSGDESPYPKYLDATGSIRILKTPNDSYNFTLDLQNLEFTKADSPNPPNTKTFYFDSYSVVLENTSTTQRKEIFSITKVRENRSFKQTNFNSQENVSSFDRIAIYGKIPPQFNSFEFLSYPILTGEIVKKNGQISLVNRQQTIQLQNEHGFLQYQKAHAAVKLFSFQKENQNTEILVQVLDVQGFQPLTEDPVVLLATDNTEHEMLTQQVNDTVKNIFEENPQIKNKILGEDEEFTEEQVLLVDGYQGLSLNTIFLENAYFLGNEITLIPFEYRQEYGFETIKNAIENAQEDKITTIAKINGQNQEIPIDIDLYFFETTENSSGFSFELSVDDLFELIESGADEQPFTIEINGFAGELAPTDEQE